MRIAHVAGFDAAGVAWNLGQAIRRHWPIHQSYSILAQDGGAHPCDATFKEKPDEAKEILDSVDVVVLHCGTWDWSAQPMIASEPVWLNTDTHEAEAVKPWAKPDKAVIWLDGSVAVRHNVDRWRARYAGYRIIATNPDVAALYGAEWMPAPVHAMVDEGHYSRPAHVRPQRVLCHPYTDRALKGHELVLAAAGIHREAWEVRPAQGLPHSDCLKLMAEADVIADHFRGYFGVVSLEATAIGRPVLLNVAQDTARAMAKYGWPVPQSWLNTGDRTGLSNWLAILSAAPQDLWESYSVDARCWWSRYGRNAYRVERFIEWLSRS